MEEEYWLSESTKSLYKNLIIINKFIQSKFESKEFDSLDDLEKLKNSLHEDQNSVTINQEVLNKIEKIGE